LIENETKYLDAAEASEWELVNPDDLVANCYMACQEAEPGFMEGPCDGQCGMGGFCCNGAFDEPNEGPPFNVCNSDQMAPLLQHSPRIMHSVCVRPVAVASANNGDDLVCVPDCGPNQTSVNGECECDAGFSPSGGSF